MKTVVIIFLVASVWIQSSTTSKLNKAWIVDSLTTQEEHTGPFPYKLGDEAQTYTILVEAKDRGEKMQLSSTSAAILNIIDKHTKTKDASDSSVLKTMKQVGVMERMKSEPVQEVMTMCLSEDTTSITALKPALYSPPLHVKLTGDVQGKWRLPSPFLSDNDTSVRLIKESGVHVGDHQLTLNISDSQGQYSVQTLSLHVCDCDGSANCKDPETKKYVTAVAALIVTTATLLLLGILLIGHCRIGAKKVEEPENVVIPDSI